MTDAVNPIELVALLTVCQLKLLHDLQLSLLVKLASLNQSYDALAAETIFRQFISALDLTDFIFDNFILVNLHYPCDGNLS